MSSKVDIQERITLLEANNVKLTKAFNKKRAKLQKIDDVKSVKRTILSITLDAITKEIRQNENELSKLNKDICEHEWVYVGQDPGSGRSEHACSKCHKSS
jgi:N-acetylneuraminic acid mutarotase